MALAITLGKLVLLLAATLLLVVGCSRTDGGHADLVNPSHDLSAAVKAIYAKDCNSCHGTDGSGGPVKLDDGTTLKVPSLREGHALKHDDAKFVKQITEGGDGMPKFGDKLSRQEIIDLTRFIRTEFQGLKK